MRSCIANQSGTAHLVSLIALNRCFSQTITIYETEEYGSFPKKRFVSETMRGTKRGFEGKLMIIPTPKAQWRNLYVQQTRI